MAAANDSERVRPLEAWRGLRALTANPDDLQARCELAALYLQSDSLAGAAFEVQEVLRIDPDDATLVRAIVSLAHNLGLEVVAEGVETRSQLDFLRREGCDAAQGYLIGRPQPQSEVRAMLARASSERRHTGEADGDRPGHGTLGG